MNFVIDVCTDSQNKNIINECLDAMEEVLSKDGTYFGVGCNLDNKSFKELSIPLIKFLQKNYNPHTKIIIDCNSAEIVEGILSEVYPNND